MGFRLIKRALETLITVFVASLVLFALIRLAPGDPAKLLIGSTFEVAIDVEAYDTAVNEMREQMGLTESVPNQYFSWMGSLLRLDLGNSYYTGRAVTDELGERLPATLLLAATALLFQVIAGFVMGTLSAVYNGTFLDSAVRIFCVGLASVPGFVIGLLLLLLLAVKFGIYEITSQATLSRLWLPAFTMGLLGAPQMIRVVRANLLSELGQIYIQSAVSRGLSQRRVVWHAMRNALIPTITLIGLSFTAFIGGAVIVESIFAWPGLGGYALDAILNKDYPALQGYALATVASVVLIHIMVDAIYAVLDPRVSPRKSKAVTNE